MNAFPVDRVEDADFLLEVRIVSYGIDAGAWDANAYFKIEVEALLIDLRGGRLVWETEFDETEPISPAFFLIVGVKLAHYEGVEAGRWIPITQPAPIASAGTHPKDPGGVSPGAMPDNCPCNTGSAKPRDPHPDSSHNTRHTPRLE